MSTDLEDSINKLNGHSFQNGADIDFLLSRLTFRPAVRIAPFCWLTSPFERIQSYISSLIPKWGSNSKGGGKGGGGHDHQQDQHEHLMLNSPPRCQQKRRCCSWKSLFDTWLSSPGQSIAFCPNSVLSWTQPMFTVTDNKAWFCHLSTTLRVGHWPERQIIFKRCRSCAKHTIRDGVVPRYKLFVHSLHC